VSDYDTDILEWSERQSALLRRLAAGEQINDRIDWPNIIDEVETAGRCERAALRSHIAVVLEHLMKLQASPAPDPRSGPEGGWRVTIVRARRDIERTLQDSPSLRPAVAGMIADEMPAARKIIAATLAAYGEAARVEVDGLAYSQAQILEDWFPEE
jgi:hypothetical protein